MNNGRAATTFLLLIVACCSLLMGQTPPTSGLEGVISISPSHGGPARIGVPNSRPYANVDFVVKKADNTVASFKTDDEGRFRILLVPGRYVISMKEGRGGIGRRAGPFEVDIVEGQVKQVQWTCDSGMR
jgi:hypothetical protein